MAALAPVKPLYSASATATNGSDTIVVTGSVNCSFIASGAIVSLGTRQLVDAISGTAPDGSGISTIKLRRPWDDPTTTEKLLVFMSWEGLADAVNRLREIINSSEASLQGAFSYMGDWDASAGDFPPAPGENLGSHKYRVSVAGTMGGRAYKVGETLYYDQYASQWRSELEVVTAFSTGVLQSADAAAWREALGVVKTTSAVDTNGGRVMQVGDHGLGSVMGGVILSDFNGIDRTTFARINIGAANQPTPASASFNVMNMASSSNTNTQIAMPWSSSLPQMWLRSQSNSYAPWVFTYHNRNILGTVSQSNGVPLSAIIERGSNGNGDYVKYADGTLICTLRRSDVFSVANALGSEFVGVAQTWNFPATFINNNTVVYGSWFRTTDGTYGNFYVAAEPTPTAQTQLIPRSAISVGGLTRNTFFVAIGRWY